MTEIADGPSPAIDPPRQLRDVVRLLLSFGTGAFISGGLAFATGVQASGRDQHSRQCEIASDVFRDDDLNARLRNAQREALIAAASDRLSRCLKEPL